MDEALRWTSAGRSSPLIRMLGGASGGTDPRALLRRRVGIYALCGAAFLLGYWIYGNLTAHLYEVDLPTSWLLHVEIPLATACVCGWLAARRLRLGITGLYTLEAALTLLLCGSYALVVHQVGDRILPGWFAVIGWMNAMTMTLLLRAVVVPSTMGRTAVLSLLAYAALFSVATQVDPAPAELLRLEFGAPSYVVTWGLGFTAVGAVTSAVIYGLQARVRAALRLGQYHLTRKLGEGGMGVVYLAEHVLLKRETAVKVLPPEKAGLDAIARFEREVVHTSRLAHPNTVQIYDYGRTPQGLFYYAMEYLQGLTLEELVAEDGPQPPARVVHLLRQAAAALAEAHGRGLVHRDVKPANLMVCHRGGVPDMLKVLDFGLVKELATASKDPSLSQAGALAGTPLYLAPEAIRGDALDGRADLYALGAVAYYLLTGEPVFEGTTTVEICAAHLHREPAPPSERVPEIPDALEGLVLQLLAKDPTERPADGAALVRELDALQLAGWDADARVAWWEARGALVRRLRAGEAPASTNQTLAVALTVPAVDPGAPVGYSPAEP
ncbi:MAG: serine/threonine protein kinase [Sandaracinus sp.]|nr:serine/threonine protein kinase [Myxococcales bacterium]MAT28435.1 serine/threonine protein kinase [Sandaracinus sp.]MBJ70402.1 serine/threonine protein kinase [Sandaracinus sp.]